MKRGRFHIWTIENVGDAMELLTEILVGEINDLLGINFISHKAYEKLERYNGILSKPMNKDYRKSLLKG